MERVAEASVPEKQYSENAESYHNADGYNRCKFVNNQFDCFEGTPLKIIIKNTEPDE